MDMVRKKIEGKKGRDEQRTQKNHNEKNTSGAIVRFAPSLTIQ